MTSVPTSHGANEFASMIMRRDAQTTSAPEMPDLGAYVQQLTHDWAKVLTALGFILIPLFLVLDIFMMPEALLGRFAMYRGITTAIVVAQYSVVRLTKPSRGVFIHGYFFTLVVGFMIARMTADLGGFGSTYYAGLNLVMIAVNLLLPWNFIHSIINSVLIIGLYIGLNLYTPQAAEIPAVIVLNNLYFLCSTAVISVSINFVKQRLIKREFLLRSDLRTARDALWGEMEVAKHIQTALLPHLPGLPGFEVGTAMLPADEVGGDYYDIIRTPTGESWVCVGDVSGHGVESGLIMMMSQTSIFTTVCNEPKIKPARALGRVNGILRQNISRMGADRYMTLTLLKVEGAKVRHAGLHQDILVYRAATGKVEAVATQGSWVGVVDDLEKALVDQEFEVARGDIVLLFSDGITEAMNDKNEMYGQTRLESALAFHATIAAQTIVDRIVSEVSAFATRRSDDWTLIALRYHG